ncbi:hypothetical protein [Paraburkholderia atlantica]|nr:hypothetical protein [Paraburkholderia atlantica]
MKRFNAWSNRHPLLAIVLGYLVLVAIIVAFVPDNDAQVSAVLAHRGET